MFGFTQQVPQVNASMVYDASKNNHEIIILDVRTPEEFSKGHVQNSINIPVQDIQDKVEQIVPDKTTTTYLYCLSGSRSIVAANTMIKMGYKNVFNMTSGLLSWRAKKFPLTTS